MTPNRGHVAGVSAHIAGVRRLRWRCTAASGLLAGLPLVVAACLLGTTAYAQAQDSAASAVTASGCWIRQLPANLPSGGFLTLHNSGDKAVVLQGASSADYGHVMMHQTTESDGVSRMSEVHEITLQPGQTFEFRPGGHHLMLEEPRAGLKVGDTIQVVFETREGQRFNASCEIKPATAMPGKMQRHQMDHQPMGH